MTNMKINETCKSRRCELKITQRELASKIGVRIATISDFETGKKGINSKTLDLILEELQLEIKPV